MTKLLELHEKHSELYQQKIKPTDEIIKIPLNALSDDLSYVEITDLLREVNDAQFGIVSTLKNNKVWERDATRAFPLEGRLSHDHPVIEANNTLLRCLSRLRPIDYAIGKKTNLEGESRPIREEFSKLSQQILGIAQNDELSDNQKLTAINQAEKKFNTFLIRQLYEANLTQGCETDEDAEKLLFHYRNLSSVLTPARIMVTLTYDEVAKVFQREIQDPVTEKTPKQKKMLATLQEIAPYPLSHRKNAHTSRNLATQEADSLFADRIVSDETLLPAQTRKTHLMGAKNAFIVKNELIRLDDAQHAELLQGHLDLASLKVEDEKKDTFVLARSASPVYVGKGEKSKQLHIHTVENLEQIRLKAQKVMGEDQAPKLQVISLNTNTPLEHQGTIVKGVGLATRYNKKPGDNFTYAPTNADGTFRALNIAPDIEFPEGKKPKFSAPLQKASRVEKVVQVALAVLAKIKKELEKATLLLIQCASGQDRTGTIVEETTQQKMEKWYKDHDLPTDNIATARARGGNAAEITTHLVNGSPGMKKESITNNFFGKDTTFDPEVTRELYRSSANTNKKNKVGNVHFLGQPNESAVAEFKKNLSHYRVLAYRLSDELHQSEKTVREVLVNVTSTGLFLVTQVAKIADNPEKLDAKSLSDLNLVITTATKGLKDPSDPIVRDDLAGLARHVSGKQSRAWKALGLALIAFSGALVLLGGLAAIPTGGASLLLSAVGTGALAAGGALVAGTAIAGVVIFNKGREKGLAKSVSQYRSSFFKVDPCEIKHAGTLEQYNKSYDIVAAAKAKRDEEEEKNNTDSSHQLL